MSAITPLQPVTDNTGFATRSAAAPPSWHGSRGAEPLGPQTLPEGLTIPSKPDAAFLSHVLRNPTLWPEEFGPWNYCGIGTCAIGLAGAIWNEPNPNSYWLADHFCLDRAVSARTFCGLGFAETGKWIWGITPEDVADALDAAIAAKVPA